MPGQALDEDAQGTVRVVRRRDKGELQRYGGVGGVTSLEQTPRAGGGHAARTISHRISTWLWTALPGNQRAAAAQTSMTGARTWRDGCMMYSKSTLGGEVIALQRST
jgi:hypothetical protein